VSDRLEQIARNASPMTRHVGVAFEVANFDAETARVGSWARSLVTNKWNKRPKVAESNESRDRSRLISSEGASPVSSKNPRRRSRLLLTRSCCGFYQYQAFVEKEIGI